MFHPGQYCYQSGYTAEEFARVIAGNFTGPASVWHLQSQSRHSWLVTHRRKSFSMQVSIRPLAPRQLGLLSLPVLEVIFQPAHDDDELERQFFTAFSQYFHKGGG